MQYKSFKHSYWYNEFYINMRRGMYGGGYMMQNKRKSFAMFRRSGFYEL